MSTIKLPKEIELDHVDIVTSHICNKNCKSCIDKFRGTSKQMISLELVERFLKALKAYTSKRLEILLLGGEPTVLPASTLEGIANIIHNEGYIALMSTNGILKEKIVSLIDVYDSIQITVETDNDIDYWRPYSEKVNIKLAGDASLTREKIEHFAEYTTGFSKRSITMYFTPDFTELCSDNEVWELLNLLDWKQNGSYMYAFYKGVRIKKCIHGLSNCIDEPTIPKLYPNGNYNKSWSNEDLDDYLFGTWSTSND